MENGLITKQIFFFYIQPNTSTLKIQNDIRLQNTYTHGTHISRCFGTSSKINGLMNETARKKHKNNINKANEKKTHLYC